MNENESPNNGQSSLESQPKRYPEDERKSVSAGEQVDSVYELLELAGGDDYWANLRDVAHLFAGNNYEVKALLEKLVQANNTSCNLVVVDKAPPDNNALADFTLPDNFPAPTTLRADAFHYIASQATDSFDLITCFGAEYLMIAASVGKDAKQNLELFREHIPRLLRPGGILIAPSNLGDTAFKHNPAAYGLKRLFSDIYQKLPHTSDST